MRIDANQQAQQAANSERAGSQPPAGASATAAGGASALGEDQAQLSGFHLQVQSLIAQLASLPETTQQKVNALRDAVSSGKYQVSPDHVAGALFANLVTKLAA